jgi:excisionase family DNA binding protein
MEDPFFSKARSIREVAEYMQSTEPFIRSEISRGRLTVRKFGKQFLRILPEDLRAWVKLASKNPGKSKPKKHEEEPVLA